MCVLRCANDSREFYAEQEEPPAALVWQMGESMICPVVQVHSVCVSLCRGLLWYAQDGWWHPPWDSNPIPAIEESLALPAKLVSRPTVGWFSVFDRNCFYSCRRG